MCVKNTVFRLLPVSVIFSLLISLLEADHQQVCHRAHNLPRNPAWNSLSSLYLSIFKFFRDILAEIWRRRVGDPRCVG